MELREYLEAVKEIDRDLLALQKRMAALRGEAELVVDRNHPAVTTLLLKTKALGHMHNDLACLPEAIERFEAARRARESGGGR